MWRGLFHRPPSLQTENIIIDFYVYSEIAYIETGELPSMQEIQLLNWCDEDCFTDLFFWHQCCNLKTALPSLNTCSIGSELEVARMSSDASSVHIWNVEARKDISTQYPRRHAEFISHWCGTHPGSPQFPGLFENWMQSLKRRLIPVMRVHNTPM